jgi:hypothetical protein
MSCISFEVGDAGLGQAQHLEVVHAQHVEVVVVGGDLAAGILLDLRRPERLLHQLGLGQVAEVADHLHVGLGEIGREGRGRHRRCKGYSDNKSADVRFHP